ncbi:MAG: hypothetical protein JWM68_2022 [Verrucomicrobiales bacterium]|nr:hypothetical protein [Verrucomicrobiales bacterium]
MVFAGLTALTAARHHDDIHLAHNTPENINADVAAVEVSVLDYNQSNTRLRQCYQIVSEKTEAAKTCATITREILKLKLGNQHSQRWINTGFADSLAMPRSATELLPVVFFLGRYLGENPGLQVPDLNVTADYLGTLHQDLLGAINAVNQELTQNGKLLSLRNENVAKLRKRMSDLVAELKQLLDPMDGRWHSFGLNIPGLEETPEAPEEIEAIVVHHTTALLTIPPVARANYYRIYQRIVGVDAEPLWIGSPSDPDFTIENLPLNSSVEFSVTAVNGGGESPLSEPVMVTIPPLVKSD